jgi:hypothetical protein
MTFLAVVNFMVLVSNAAGEARDQDSLSTSIYGNRRKEHRRGWEASRIRSRDTDEEPACCEIAA